MKGEFHRRFQVLALGAGLFFVFLFSGLSPVFGCSQTLNVMAYNVENLWDATNDPDQKDPTFLPMAEKSQGDPCRVLLPNYRKKCRNLNWTQEKYKKKLQTIADVITTLGGSPEILVFEELERQNVLQDLLDKHLAAEGYEHLIYYESPGRRGMDVGMITKIPYVFSASHPVDYNGNGTGNTRDILEVEFKNCGFRFVVTANHWPSQGSSTSRREAAADVLKHIVEGAQNRGVPVISVGDFNTLSPDLENPNPIIGRIAGTLSNPGSFSLVDLGVEPEGSDAPSTSYWYWKTKWQKFDRVLVTPDLLRERCGLCSPPTFQVIWSPDLLTEDERSGDVIPWRYDFFSATGFSDHLPIQIQLTFREPAD